MSGTSWVVIGSLALAISARAVSGEPGPGSVLDWQSEVVLELAAMQEAGTVWRDNVLVVPERFEVTIDDATITLEPRGVEWIEHLGVRVISGKVVGGESFVISCGPDGSDGAIWTGEQTFELKHQGPAIDSERALFRAQELGALPWACGGVLRDDTGDDNVLVLRAGPDTPEQQPEGDTESEVRVLVIADPASMSGYGSLASFAASAIASTNSAFSNSNVSPMRLTLAGAESVAWTEPSNNSSGLLRALTNRYDRKADAAHALRDAYDADMVAYLVDLSDACGRAWLTPDDPLLAFSVTDPSCAIGNLTFAHELGHNFGCAHDPENAGSSYRTYGFGYRWDNDTRRSVMAYAPGSRVPHFSNPLVSYQGFPTGVADANDNVRVLDETDALLAIARTGDGSGPDCDASGENDQVQIARDPSLDADDNGVLDTCQIASDPGLDCDGNGVLDSAQLNPRVVVDLGSASTFGTGVPVVLTGPASPEPTSDVIVYVQATGDIGLSSETVEVDFGVPGGVFTAFATGGADCFSPGTLHTQTFPASTLAQTLQSGPSALLTSSSAVGATLCSTSSINIWVEYQTTDTAVDVNGNGVLDTCEAPACDADWNTDGFFSVGDILDFLAAWASASDPRADWNTDGFFSVGDILDFLAAWSARCP